MSREKENTYLTSFMCQVTESEIKRKNRLSFCPYLWIDALELQVPTTITYFLHKLLYGPIIFKAHPEFTSANTRRMGNFTERPSIRFSSLIMG